VQRATLKSLDAAQMLKPEAFEGECEDLLPSVNVGSEYPFFGAALVATVFTPNPNGIPVRFCSARILP
jgi:hypothetical protein